MLHLHAHADACLRVMQLPSNGQRAAVVTGQVGRWGSTGAAGSSTACSGVAWPAMGWGIHQEHLGDAEANAEGLRPPVAVPQCLQASLTLRQSPALWEVRLSRPGRKGKANLGARWFPAASPMPDVSRCI